jgi:hypothetical protein
LISLVSFLESKLKSDINIRTSSFINGVEFEEMLFTFSAQIDLPICTGFGI